MVELLFGSDDFEHLAGRKYIHELLVVLLLYLLYLNVDGILFLDSLCTHLIIIGIGVAVSPHLAKERTLLALHLTIEREEYA